MAIDVAGSSPVSGELLSDSDVGLGAAVAPGSTGLLSDDDVGLSSARPTPTLASSAVSPFVGFNRGLADFAGAPVDVTNWALGKLGLPVSHQPFLGSESIRKGLGVIGANPDTAPPRSGLESVLQAGGSGAAQMLAPEMALGTVGRAGIKMAPAVGEFLQSAFGAASTPAAVAKNLAVGAASGAGGQGAGMLFPEGSTGQKAAELAGGLVGGGLGAVATDIHPWQALKSFTAPMRAEGQSQLAGEQLRGAASSPAAAVDMIENAPRELVPGSEPTTFQLTGDMGLGGLERRVQTQNPALFNEARAGQNRARLDALGNLQPAGSPEDVSAALRARLNGLSTQADADVGAATQSARDAASGIGGEQSPAFYGEQIRGAIQPQLDAATQHAAGLTNELGGAGTPETYGAALREPLQGAKDSARAARGALYRAIDPTGSLNIVTASLRDAGDAAAAGLSKMAAPPSGEEAAILGTIRSLPDVVPFNDLQALDSRITAAMSAERRGAGETPVWGRLSQMKGAAQTAIDNGVANQVAYERAQVEKGAMAPDETIHSRLQAWSDEADRQAAMGSGRGSPEQAGAVAASSAPHLFGEAGAGGGRYGSPNGNQGLSPGVGAIAHQAKAPRAVGPPQNLLSFLRENGGIKDVGGNLRAQDMHLQYPGLINNKTGMDPDIAREAAAEAGYLGPDIDHAMSETTENDLWDAIANHPTYSIKDADRLQAYQNWQGEQKVRGHAQEIRKNLAIYGDKVRPELVRRAAEIMASDGKPWDDALESAAIRAEHEEWDSANAKSALGSGVQAPPAGGVGARSGQEGLPSEPRKSPGASDEYRAPNFDEAAAGRLSAAKQAHSAYAQTYRQGPVGNLLKTTGFSGQYRMPNAAVPEAVFQKGPKGFEAATSFRKAANNDPAALAAARNYAAMTLRRVAERPDGTIDPGKFSSWKAAYGDALRAFPELMPKFATAVKASAELNRFEPFRADMAPFQVPEVFFHSGAGGREGVDNLRRLVGDAKARSLIEDYAASKLRASALRPDGTLDPAAVARFQKSHADALRSFPALSDAFSTAAKASETINEVAALHKKTSDAFQAGAIGRIMNAAPADVVKHVGAIFGQKDAGSQMARLAGEAQRGGHDAVDGLRKAVADFLTSRFVSNTEAGTSGANLVKSDAFQTFMRQSKPALEKIFTPKEIDSLNAIAADLHRANRTVTAVRIPGGSNTAQDLTAVNGAEHGPSGSLLNSMVVGGALGHEAHGLPGVLYGAGLGAVRHVVNAARAAGYGRVDELVRDAMLDPDLARMLMMKAPINAGRGAEPALRQKLMRVGTYSAAQTWQSYARP